MAAPGKSKRHDRWMRPRAPLPPELAVRPFRVDEASALGVTPKQLRHPGLRRPFHGVRVPETVPDAVVTTCAAAALVLPRGARFEGATAAALLQVPVPRRVSPVQPVLVQVSAGTRPPRVSGVRTRIGRPTTHGVVIRGPAGDLRCVDLPELAQTLAADPRLTPDDLIAALDAIATRLTGTTDMANAPPARAPRTRARLAAALPHVAWPVRSPQETALRLVLYRHGLPRADLNRALLDEAGTGSGEPDLSGPEVRVAAVYEGDHHGHDSRQERRDIGRDRLAANHGWRISRVTAEDLAAGGHRLAQDIAVELWQRGLRWPGGQAGVGIG